MDQFLLLPGLGSDGRLGHAQRTLPYNVITPDYIESLAGETLKEYSIRFFKDLCTHQIVDPERPLHLAGISFGGAVAQVIATIASARSLVLIGSLKRASELRPIVRTYALTLNRVMPATCYQVSRFFQQFVMGKVSGIPEDEIALCLDMYRMVPKQFFRSALTMLGKWEGCEVRQPMLRIHGEKDHIISLNRTQGVDLVIRGGRHLISLSHPEIVNRAILEFHAKL